MQHKKNKAEANYKIQFGKRAGDQMLFFLENFYEAIKKRACDQTCLKTAKYHN